jgi:hypothetical protein
MFEELLMGLLQITLEPLNPGILRPFINVLEQGGL